MSVELLEDRLTDMSFITPQKPNHPLPIPLMLHLRGPRLLNLTLQHLLRHLPLRRISIHAPRMDQVDRVLQNSLYTNTCTLCNLL